MSKASREKKKAAMKDGKKAKAPTKNMKMDVEFGQELSGEHKRAADAVETRVKSSAQRYGMNCDMD